MKFLEKIPDWLRWILFLPASILALLISYPLIIFLNRITMIGFLEGFFVDIMILFVAGLWSSIGFILVGSIVAPKSNFPVSIILSVLYAFMMGFSLYSKFILGDTSSVSWLELIINSITGLFVVVAVILNYSHEKE